ncbi:hypothetical protein V502_07167 [Pseudogymnoascus sp. VKM F-4520 (FW-2644)]|nr:hypothetical protein V502_07167 [Pseudogymnoascus sp. VKM F-4520 (FW-2644)]
MRASTNRSRHLAPASLIIGPHGTGAGAAAADPWWEGFGAALRTGADPPAPIIRHGYLAPTHVEPAPSRAPEPPFHRAIPASRGLGSCHRIAEPFIGPPARDYVGELPRSSALGNGSSARHAWAREFFCDHEGVMGSGEEDDAAAAAAAARADMNASYSTEDVSTPASPKPSPRGLALDERSRKSQSRLIAGPASADHQIPAQRRVNVRRAVTAAGLRGEISVCYSGRHAV